ncbi:2-oxoglutarate dehydrogenase E1 component [Chitinophaga qingshengii]|uniref:oxoglutarate dehydrogenase (succinyl-transferring) n=1 Tax=Chitinophaga qingshengii TaxID=1569794 RepID=A0ABR7TMC7_9BACT|nr:2-oxoglutarate dehydrogenase E1 component [Chitinophaga qingshengii]MBC9930657.1 2-oxoglutarate dehydrogenase E1 component [Chitinophaga qingshengii]
MKDFSFVTNSHPAYIESLYQDFLKDPNSVDPDWVKFFEGFDFAVSNANANGKAAGAATAAGGGSVPVNGDQQAKELGVYRLIMAYRKKGHLIAKTNPIRERKDRRANLDLASYGLGDADLKTRFYAGTAIGLKDATLEEIVAHLKKIYAGSVGIQYTYINDRDKAKWLEKEFEKLMTTPLSLEQRRRVMQKLNQGVIFEKFLHTKYIGQKRFGLEGGESTIPALDAMINTAAEYGVQESVIGMAHRGRLNVLANILGKTYEQIFNEFEGLAVPDMTMGSGDVKYHLGFRSQITTPAGKAVNLQLMPNPSHLEVVDPIVIGFSRSKADVIYDSDYDKILPILIHGDAAVAGQGIVYEVEQMSKLKGYYTGGTIHFVINNQIGFTTDFDDARSSDYCTSVASIVQAPVFHVNGDDTEAVVKVSQLAARYRQEFNEDIYIDMVCYRKHGHNEGDEPKFTQPSLYALIDKHPNPREVYTQYLLNNGESDAQALAKEMETSFWADLQARFDEVKQHPLPYFNQKPEEWWQALRKATREDFESSPVTAIKEEEFKRLFDGLMKWPENFVPLRKVSKLLQDKIKLYQEEGKVDWATGELLAYASLLTEGKDVRMSGEDVKRGTFSHRHAVLFDENTNETYNRLSELSDKQGKFRIYNSLLSEYGVLGFEYGYAMANPNALVVWEAQYGDFVNGAQTVIDQYISSAEQKWTTQNGLVMLLPHGYEGGGPDHSNARPERFLQTCAEENMVITNITTAANFFHALRRQLTWQFRKPLINFSPKANLRHVGAYSTMEEFTHGGFKEVLDDPFITDASVVKKVLLCTGKMYFDLSDKQVKENRKDVAIVRLEQLYPLPVEQLEAIEAKYKGATFFWVQEEPLNMGAATYLQMNLKQINYGVISRNPSASTATGYAKVHAREQQQIIDTAFNI